MQKINLKNVISDKNPSLAKRLPKFVIRWIENVLHLDEINDHISKHGEKDGVENANAFLEGLNVTYTLHGIENIKPGRYQFASNHPLGGLDGVCLISVINKYFGEPRFMVNDVLLNLKFFKSIFVPVNAFGSTSKENAILIENAYSSDKPIIIFPSGMVSRKINGKVADLVWKKSFIQKSIDHKRDVVPVYFDGFNTKRFYRLANFRKWLGIKANLEMFLLPDEMYKKRNAHFDIYFGDPIPWEQLANEKNVRFWTDQIRKIVYTLKS